MPSLLAASLAFATPLPQRRNLAAPALARSHTEPQRRNLAAPALARTHSLRTHPVLLSAAAAPSDDDAEELRQAASGVADRVRANARRGRHDQHAAALPAVDRRVDDAALRSPQWLCGGADHRRAAAGAAERPHRALVGAAGLHCRRCRGQPDDGGCDGVPSGGGGARAGGPAPRRRRSRRLRRPISSRRAPNRRARSACCRRRSSSASQSGLLLPRAAAGRSRPPASPIAPHARAQSSHSTRRSLSSRSASASRRASARARRCRRLPRPRPPSRTVRQRRHRRWAALGRSFASARSPSLWAGRSR